MPSRSFLEFVTGPIWRFMGFDLNGPKIEEQKNITNKYFSVLWRKMNGNFGLAINGAILLVFDLKKNYSILAGRISVRAIPRRLTTNYTQRIETILHGRTSTVFFKDSFLTSYIATLVCFISFKNFFQIWHPPTQQFINCCSPHRHGRALFRERSPQPVRLRRSVETLIGSRRMRSRECQ